MDNKKEIVKAFLFTTEYCKPVQKPEGFTYLEVDANKNIELSSKYEILMVPTMVIVFTDGSYSKEYLGK